MSALLKKARQIVTMPENTRNKEVRLQYYFELTKAAYKDIANVTVKKGDMHVLIYWKELLVSNAYLIEAVSAIESTSYAIEILNKVESEIDNGKIKPFEVYDLGGVKTFEFTINNIIYDDVSIEHHITNGTVSELLETFPSKNDFMLLRIFLSDIKSIFDDVTITKDEEKQCFCVKYENFNLGTFYTKSSSVILDFLKSTVINLRILNELKAKYPKIELKVSQNIDGFDVLYFDLSAYNTTSNMKLEDIYLTDGQFEKEWLINRINLLTNNVA